MAPPSAPASVRCLACGHEYELTATAEAEGTHGCPVCGGTSWIALDVAPLRTRPYVPKARRRR